MVWDPKQITPKAWPEVVAFYRRIEDRNDDFRPLRVLAEHVATQAYAASLSVAVSGTSLLVARRAGADWVQDSLRIDVGLSTSIRLIVRHGGAARPTTLEIESPTVPVLVAAFEGILAKADWG
jgi:hypothetical protein